jgi:ubiquinone/menaquinone biosynthesis C-methylase UbiE
MLTRQQAREFYDRRGGQRNRHPRHERKAIKRLIEFSDFQSAESVVDFGCGSGILGERLLEHELPPEATYAGFDLSEAMVQACRKRLIRFGARASVTRTDGRPRIPMPPESCDRFVSTYVLDLLPSPDIARTLEQAWKVLRPDGLLCLASVTYGTTALARLVIAGWLAAHSLRPSLVGGCRPVSLSDYLGPASWKVLHSSTVTWWGVPSQVLVARPTAHGHGNAGNKPLDRR